MDNGKITSNDYELTLESFGGLNFYISQGLLERHEIIVGFIGRQGGVSSEPYDALNLALHVGDDPADVLKNREMVANALGLSAERFTCAEQVHKTSVAIVDEMTVGRGAFSFDDSMSGVDALITGAVDVPLMLFFADCVPVVLVETERRIVAVAHAGWRGVFDNIIERTVLSMTSFCSARPDKLLAFVGPAIGGCCYEVGTDLARRFLDRFDGSDDWLNGSKIDLRVLVGRQLRSSGVTAEGLNVIDRCTSCGNDELFSYRADGGTTGRHAAIASIR